LWPESRGEKLEVLRWVSWGQAWWVGEVVDPDFHGRAGTCLFRSLVEGVLLV
jgi:hypothetical protein